MDNQAYYTCPEIFKARELLPGIDTHWGELTFSTSYYRRASASTNFSEFTTFFDIESITFLNTIEINASGSGYQRVCVPYGSQISLGNKMVTGCAWPYNCPVDGVLTTYNGDELLCDQSILMQNSPFITTPRATSLDLPEDGNRGHEFIYYLNHKISIEGGPERELPNYEKIGIYNGFAALKPKALNVVDNIYIEPNQNLTLEAELYPHLAASEGVIYEWRYIKNDTMPGEATFTPSILYEPNTIFLASTTGAFSIYYFARNRLGITERSPNLNVYVGNVLSISSPPKDTTYWITPTPEMPTIEFKAKLSNVPDSIAKTFTYSWHIAVVYRASVWGTDSIQFNGETQDSVWIPKWNGEFAGGAVIGKVEVRYQDSTYVATLPETLNVKILGRNIEGNRETVVNGNVNTCV